MGSEGHVLCFKGGSFYNLFNTGDLWNKLQILKREPAKISKREQLLQFKSSFLLNAKVGTEIKNHKYFYILYYAGTLAANIFC